jgi:UDP-N-acetylglucosamine diphosphorylase/glucosamine-1-phosphate N-acetyltransferase
MLAVVVLSAGKGTRMKSDLPKVLHTLGGRTLIDHVLQTARALVPDRLILVVGHRHEDVRKQAMGEDIEFVLQEPQLGTGHAVQQAEPLLNGEPGEVVILAGDAPLLRAETLKRMIAKHRTAKAVATVLSANAPDPFGYGRIIRGEDGRFLRIVEEKEATEAERRIREVNSGVYCLESPLVFETLCRVKPDNSKGEFYLTDVIGLLSRDQRTVQAVDLADFYEIRGINTVDELGDAEHRLAKNG